MFDTTFIAAYTTPARYAEVTGLVFNRGFVAVDGTPCGLYPAATARRVADALSTAGINHRPTPARSYNEGKRKVGLS